MPPIQFLIERYESGQTVTEVIRKRYKLTWARAKRIVANGHIRLAGQVTRAPEQRVKTGNRFWIAAGVLELKYAPGTEPVTKARLPKPASKAVLPEKIPKKAPPTVNTHAIEIVYIDDEIIVVNKPAGLTTNRSKEDREEFGDESKFLPKTLAELLPVVIGIPNRTVYAVHRLDRDTTGLLVFARTAAMSKILVNQFRGRLVDRRYQALTRGVPPAGRIESHIVPDRGDGRRGSGKPGTPESKRAVTSVSVLEELKDYALVDCKLDTGRTHQIRIHLGEAGHPLCGERIYDRPLKGKPLPDASGAKRPMLHAFRLGFKHPETQAFVGWEVDPPEDFTGLLREFRQLALNPVLQE